MRIQLRIVSGALRGRKIICTVHEGVRPTPEMVREALFSILGDAVPDRPFFDVFAGSGAVGMEALSRGARSALLIERDFRLAGDIEHNLQQFGIQESGRVLKADVYRWAQRWQPPAEPVNVFVSPPFKDLTNRLDEFVEFLGGLQQKLAPGSVLVVQAEKGFPIEELPAAPEWEERRYGRNLLLIWVKEAIDTDTPSSP